MKLKVNFGNVYRDIIYSGLDIRENPVEYLCTIWLYNEITGALRIQINIFFKLIAESTKSISRLLSFCYPKFNTLLISFLFFELVKFTPGLLFSSFKNMWLKFYNHI
jgi:hypothetical protein